MTWNVVVNDAPDAPPCENEEEIITDVVLTWTATDGSPTVTARAQDPDGEGPLDLQILDDIELMENTEYTLSLELLNAIEGEDITEEIMEEDHEHMFFFAWTDGSFADPSGDGNADNRGDAVNYNDFDENNLPVGLSTSWTTSTAMTPEGTFRVVLKHQPDIKSETSTIDDGGTDVDLTWTIRTVVTNVEDLAAVQSQFQIFPNPVQEQLNWQLENVNPQEVELFLYNQMGQLLKVYNAPEATISIADLPNGTYSIKARNGYDIWTQRFVKL